MIWEYAITDNTYIDRWFVGEKVKAVPYPMLFSNDASTAYDYVPNTLCDGLLVNKVIFNETLPILISNTVCDFRPQKFCWFVRKYSLVRKHITTLRLHQYDEDVGEVDHLFWYINACPNLTDLSLFIHSSEPLCGQELWAGKMFPGWDPKDLKGCSLMVLYEPMRPLLNVEGIKRFRLFVVDTEDPECDERIRARLEKEAGDYMAVERADLWADVEGFPDESEKIEYGEVTGVRATTLIVKLHFKIDK